MSQQSHVELHKLLVAEIQNNINELRRQSQRQPDPSWQRLCLQLANLNESFGKALSPFVAAAQQCHALRQLQPQLDNPGLERDIDHLEVRFDVMIAMMADLLHTMDRLMTYPPHHIDVDKEPHHESRAPITSHERQPINASVMSA